jgi:hypothetical protein
MIKNIGIAMLLLSVLYTDVELWACKQAIAMADFPQYRGE